MTSKTESIFSESDMQPEDLQFMQKLCLVFFWFVSITFVTSFLCVILFGKILLWFNSRFLKIFVCQSFCIEWDETHDAKEGKRLVCKVLSVQNRNTARHVFFFKSMNILALLRHLLQYLAVLLGATSIFKYTSLMVFIYDRRVNFFTPWVSDLSGLICFAQTSQCAEFMIQ